MLTPLFPENNGFISIKQRDAGDCYFLTSLECMFSAGEHGYSLIRRMFIQGDSGVELRFFHTAHSAHIKFDKLRGKYDYRYDRINNQDVFFISNQRLDEIDHADEGVITNSLAVKIIERISAYYYECDWDTAYRRHPRVLLRSESVSAHNTDARFQGSSTSFVSQLLGIPVLETFNLDQIILLKKIFPNQPIYMGMRVGEPNVNGVLLRHAFKIEKIRPDRHRIGHHQFILIDPSNNELQHIYTQEHIHQRAPRFAIFKTDPQIYEWISCLSQFPDLLQKVSYIKELNASFNVQDIINIFLSDIHGIHAVIHERLLAEANAYIEMKVQQINDFPMIFSPTYVTAEINREGRHLYQELRRVVWEDDRLKIALNTMGLPPTFIPQNILQALNHKSHEIHTMVEERKTMAPNVVEVIDICVQQINSFPALYVVDGCVHSIKQQRRDFLIQLDLIILSNTELNETLQFFQLSAESVIPIVEAKRNKIQFINVEADKAIERIKTSQHAEGILRHMDFFMHLSYIHVKVQALESSIQSSSAGQNSLRVARQLYSALNTAQNNLIYSETPIGEKIRAFKSVCISALGEATVHLAFDGDWRTLLFAIEDRLFSIRNEPEVIRAPSQRVGLFQRPIHSIQSEPYRRGVMALA